ncbi:MAG: MBL fold metallo-hydrolase [Dehalococcoidia bacterium]|jgi:L-ascorbate metabolism protein UlaG (beta-lactamase superfamily)|nr:MBL fold metallo-hydrolase [Dehalococcoidia bacterium]MDW8009786.1 MBL fold metallo-hydrolase [Chloroflexota bacterium]
MEIVWLGHSCFRLRGRQTTVVTDPCPPSTGYHLGRPTAQIVTVSHRHEDHSYVQGVAGNPKVLDAPGEYDIGGTFVTAVPTYHDGRKGAVRGPNLVFVLEMDGLTICHLGDLGHLPTPEQVELLSGVDVLFVPVGGHTTLDGAQAAEVVSLLEPKVVIPMHYRTPACRLSLDPLDRFLKELDVDAVEPQKRLSLTAGSLPETTEVVVLDYER